MSVEVDFTTWGAIYLAPYAQQTWEFTWIFGGDYWSQMVIIPDDDSDPSSIQVVARWVERSRGVTKHVLRIRNRSGTSVTFHARAIVAPSRY